MKGRNANREEGPSAASGLAGEPDESQRPDAYGAERAERVGSGECVMSSEEQQQYYVRRRGRVLGPLALSRIKELRSRGRLGPTDEISTDRVNWRKLQELDQPKGTSADQSEKAASLAIQTRTESSEAGLPATSGAGEWYCYANGQQLGPLSTATVRTMIQNGRLGRDDLVWREGMSEWLPVEKVPDLWADGLPARPAPPRPGPGPAFEAPFEELVGGSFWARALALVVDEFIVSFVGGLLFGAYALVTAASFGAGVALADAERLSGLFGLGIWIFFILIRPAVRLIYFGGMESSAWQATLGKKALGLVVTDEQGLRLTFTRALGRNFCKNLSTWLMLIGYLAAAFTRRRQALHDLMTGCLVVNERDLERWNEHGGRRPTT